MGSVGRIGRQIDLIMAERKTRTLSGADLETRMVRIAMIEQGLTVGQFAALCKMPAALLSDSLSKNFPYQLTRYRVEAGFQYRRPIWSDFTTLQMRRLSAERLGFDPCLVGVRELHRRAKDIGADFSLCTDKAAMIREVFARAAVRKTTSNISSL